MLHGILLGLSSKISRTKNDEINRGHILPSEEPGKEVIEFFILTTSNKGMDGAKFLQIEAENVD